MEQLGIESIHTILKNNREQEEISESKSATQEKNVKLFDAARYNNEILQQMSKDKADSSSDRGSNADQFFEMYPLKTMEIVKKHNLFSSKEEVSENNKNANSESEKQSGDDILSLPDLTLPKVQRSNQDGNAYEETVRSGTEPASNLEDVNSIVDVLPLTTQAHSMSLPVDDAVCTLDLSNVTRKYVGIHLSNYTFPSDKACKKRNQEIDRMIREREEQVKLTEEYKEMVNLTLSDTEALFAADHISIQHTRLIFKELRQLEKNITQALEARMRNDSCFTPVLNKYIQMKKELEITRVSLWNEVKATLQQQKEQAASGKAWTPRFVSQGEVYNAYRSFLTDKRVKQRASFQEVTVFSEESKFCDGCRIPTGIKNIPVIMNYPDHLLIRKFVGDEEVTTISSDTNRTRWNHG